MPEYNLNLLVNGGEISSDISRLTADSVDYVTAVFTFDESWNTLYKTAVFRIGENVYHTVLENDKCLVPHEVLSDGMIYVSVFGVLDSTRATTKEVPIYIEKSGYVICEPSAPSADPYAYFLEQSQNLKNQSEEYAASCEQAASKANQNKELCEEYKETTALAYQQTKNFYEDTVILNQEVKAAKEQVDAIEKNIISLEENAENHAALALESYNKTQAEVMSSIETHNSETNDLAHPQILKIAKEAKSIAVGKSTALCFDTKEQLDLWIEGSFVRTDGKTIDDIKIGDNLYILELEVPDYWWDGATAQPLEAEKPNLSDYYTKGEIDTKIGNALFSVMERTAYDEAYLNESLDAGRIYFVYEED